MAPRGWRNVAGCSDARRELPRRRRRPTHDFRFRPRDGGVGARRDRRLVSQAARGCRRPRPAARRPSRGPRREISPPDAPALSAWRRLGVGRPNRAGKRRAGTGVPSGVGHTSVERRAGRRAEARGGSRGSAPPGPPEATARSAIRRGDSSGCGPGGGSSRRTSACSHCPSLQSAPPGPVVRSGGGGGRSAPRARVGRDGGGLRR